MKWIYTKKKETLYKYGTTFPLYIVSIIGFIEGTEEEEKSNKI